MNVEIRQRRRPSGGAEWRTEDVVWPKGWPLPEQGCVVLGRELIGWVEHTEMDIVNEKVVVVLRP